MRVRPGRALDAPVGLPERALAPASALCGRADRAPVGAKGGGDGEAVARAATVETPLERRAEVVTLAVDDAKRGARGAVHADLRLGALRQRAEVGEVARVNGFGVGPGGQAFGGVLPDRLEH